MITQDTIAQIVNRIDIIEIVGEFVKLKKRGTNYLGNCPFHNEKTPSFTVSASKGIYKCFGCGKSGNTISFLMDHEKLSYVESLRWLAKKYNIEIQETETSQEYREIQQVADSLFIINQFGQRFFEEQLWETDNGRAIAGSYLKQRGFTEATIRKFQIGYAPDERNLLVKTALQQKYNPELLVKSGLAVKRDENTYDNYRDRIVFPIHNPSGKIIGFGARLIKKNDKAPKYINTPENELYVKSKVLYGIHFSRQAIDKANECLLVEGYTDVVSLHQAGVENVVASGGTALTPDQLRLIRKYTPNLTIIYDGDGAGIKAALRGLDLALDEGLQVQLVLIPDGEDPDSYVNKVGREAFVEFVKANKKDFILFQLETALKDAGNDSQQRSAVVNKIAESISRIDKAEDFTRQQDYIRQSANLLRIDEAGLTTLVNKFIKEKIDKNNRQQSVQPNPLASEGEETSEKKLDDTLSLLLGNELQERAVLRCLIEQGIKPFEAEKTVASFIFETLSSFHFDNPLHDKVYLTYKTWYDSGLQPTEKSFLYYDDTEMANLIISLLEFPYELSGRWAEMEAKKRPKLQLDSANADLEEEAHQFIAKDVKTSVDFFRLRKLKQMLEENQKELETAKNYDEQLLLMEMHIELKKYEREITDQLGTVIIK